MPAKSKAQFRFMGAVLNCKTKGDCPSKKIREAADEMTVKEIKDYLKGSPKNLPQKAKAAEFIPNLIKLANRLDSDGHISEADALDKIIKEIIK